MAKKESKIGSTLDRAAETVGRALGQVASTVESIPEYRAEAAAEFGHVMDVAHDMRADLSSVPGELKQAAVSTVQTAKRVAVSTVQTAKRVAATTVKAAKHARQSLSSKGRAKAVAAARKKAKPMKKAKPAKKASKAKAAKPSKKGRKKK